MLGIDIIAKIQDEATGYASISVGCNRELVGIQEMTGLLDGEASAVLHFI